MKPGTKTGVFKINSPSSSQRPARKNKCDWVRDPINPNRNHKWYSSMQVWFTQSNSDILVFWVQGRKQCWLKGNTPQDIRYVLSLTCGNFNHMQRIQKLPLELLSKRALLAQYLGVRGWWGDVSSNTLLYMCGWDCRLPSICQNPDKQFRGLPGIHLPILR